MYISNFLLLRCLRFTALPYKGANADPLNGLKRVAKYGALWPRVNLDPLNGLGRTSTWTGPWGCLGYADKNVGAVLKPFKGSRLAPCLGPVLVAVLRRPFKGSAWQIYSVGPKRDDQGLC